MRRRQVGALAVMQVIWPEAVERIAKFLRESEVHGRLEELPSGVDTPPGPALRAESYDCDGRGLVVLVPADADVDRSRLARRAGCNELRPGPPRAFPFQGARVIVERSLLSLRTGWLEAGTPRHVLGLSPSQIVRVTRAETGNFLLSD
jgi:prolyl-tRNA editing enzyme YbaK/EbsC (Cys-tRNA(Pro) deacylase)